jgi:arabinose-5-phosphate isomerase
VSGLIAQKISMTLVSTGTKSIFLSPTDALHGDIGILGQDDILVLICKDGSTDELISLIPYAKAKKVKLVGVSSEKSSRLAQLCERHIFLPLQREICPFNLAPVTSSVVQMLFGDTCAVAIMQGKSLSMEEYAMNHPAGRIGKRLILSVKEVMKPRETLPVVKPDDNGMQALVSLSSGSKGCGCLLVVDENGRLLGTLADADLRRALATKGETALSLSVRQLMNFNKSYPRTTLPNEKAYDAQQKMAQGKPVNYLPVVSDNETKTLLGLVTSRALLDAGL